MNVDVDAGSLSQGLPARRPQPAPCTGEPGAEGVIGGDAEVGRADDHQDANASLGAHARRDGLVHHVVFWADDVAAAFERLRAAGVPLLDAGPQTLASGRRLFSLRGPGGERMQITGG
jgi:catechol 2,3-dioxygenase-like lactoylglutathione lyase family enzyme